MSSAAHGAGSIGITKAWCSWNGDTTAIYSSLNVSSVTDSDVGIYSISFTIPFKDTNYAAVVSAGYDEGVVFDAGFSLSQHGNNLVTQVECRARRGSTKYDPDNNTVVVYST